MTNRAPPPAPAWASSLVAIGVTGTNGKTSTTALIASLLRSLGAPVLRTTTLGSFLDDDELDVPPHYDGFLASVLAAKNSGGEHIVLELTSEALALGFARAWPCRLGVFTNLSADHADVHPSPEHYLASKAQLFVTLQPGGTAVLNANDPCAALIADVVPAGVEKVTYGLATRGAPWTTPDLAATNVRVDWTGTTFDLAPSSRFPGLPKSLKTSAIGAIFVENALAAIAAAMSAGVAADAIASSLANALPPPGRFERVATHPYVVVDFAHSPDALARTLATARALAGSNRVHVVFGAGGNRDRTKRPLLGAAARAADRIVITSDNPRDEDPRAIIAEIQTGSLGHGDVRIEEQRAHAIELAIRGADTDDIVVIAGIGHSDADTVRGLAVRFLAG